LNINGQDRYVGCRGFVLVLHYYSYKL